MSKSNPSNKAEVLKRVELAREQLDKIPAPNVRSHFSGFFSFVREQGVVGLAIGLVIGTQVKTLADQMVISFVNPLVGLLLPGKGGLAEKSFNLSIGSKDANFLWGAFAAQVISFLTIAAVIYYVFKGLKLDKLDKVDSKKTS